MPVDNLIPLLYSSTPNTKPLVNTRLTGELWTNFPDLQLGLIDATKTAIPLIAVRYFSPNTAYVGGDFVVQAGKLYVAKAAVPIGPFNASQWAAMQTAADVAAAYLPLTGGSLTGPLTLSGNATQALHAVPLQQVNTLVTAYLPLTGGSLTGPLTLPGNATQALHAVPLQQVAALVANDNRIINGDMRIDQRNNGASGTTAGYAIDRWAYTNSTAPTGRGTWQQVASAAGGALIGMGFGYYLNFTSSGAYTPAAADNFSFFQAIEADMVTDLLWGTANAQPITLSFLASSSLTGQFGGVIANAKSGTRVYPFSFNLPAANTWTKISVTIPGDTAAGWTMSGNGIGVAVRFDLGSGANFRAPAGAWTTGDIRGATGDVNVVATNGANFSLTGVKLELGSVATPFNRKTPQESLADCQRYYQIYGNNILSGYAPSAGVGCNDQWIYVTTMRAVPTITPSNITYLNANTLAINAINASTARTNIVSVATGSLNCVFAASLDAEL